MALIRVGKKIISVDSAKGLLEISEELATGLGDAIREFFVEKSAVEKLPEQLDDYEGPDEENVAGIDNEYFNDRGDITKDN